MAIVADYYSGNTHVTIRDDAYKDLTEEQKQYQKRQIREAIENIIINNWERMLERGTIELKRD